MSLTPPTSEVAETYLDSAGSEHRIDPAVIARLRQALGTPPAGAEDSAPIVARRGDPVPVTGRLRLEGGGTLDLDGTVPEDCPLGYHTLTGPVARQLIVGPGRCYLPDRRAWGWTVQLYAARSALSWGIGDLGDLRTIVEWAAGQGAGFVLVNPLHAAAPTLPQEPSPYFPTSRAFRNPIYLRIEDVPGADRVDLRDLQQAGRAANAGPLIDRDAVWRLKRAALHRVYSQVRPEEEFARWRAEQGPALQRFATWCALADRHGASWRDWPAELRHPDGEAVPRFEREAEQAIGFYAWLQWLLQLQLSGCSDRAPGVAVIQDLPIGVDPNGADTWAWQQVMAEGVTVGAPPDPFNLSGQDWGLHPFVPWRLRQAGYQPFVEALRATLARNGGLRIDHVMGLLRLWWIPEGSPPTEGGYVSYPVADLLEIVALESHRFQALVVGEDLGTVAPGLREEMAARNMLSYRLLWFEEEPPPAWPVPALAAVTTHDLPTVAGLWSGADLADQQASGLDADPASTEQLRAHLAELAAAPAGATPQQVTVAAYRALARAPSTLLAATLEDAAGIELRPNLPGTTRRQNWSVPLPVPVEELPSLPGAAAIAEVLDRACRTAAAVAAAAADTRHAPGDRLVPPPGKTSDT
ncbi:4-alpha-glucanotransferase [Jatrophihabitans sp.]|uniref:4-alpha-glucanotransferase n=1 Tax=Jatrophihabitans sp. TaxID=1932789 RepID=UPI002B91A1FF|nr:4-alpha-glucanotransferase [Jatrophihabitans sp.]